MFRLGVKFELAVASSMHAAVARRSGCSHRPDDTQLDHSLLVLARSMMMMPGVDGGHHHEGQMI